MAKRKSKPRTGEGKRVRKLRTPAEYFALPKRQQEAQKKAAHVLSAMRTENVSLYRAAREHEISPKTVLKHARSALLKTSRGTYKARARDAIIRVLVLPTPRALAEIATLDSRSATIVADYWNAVHRFLETGYDTELARFRGKSIIDAQGNPVPLLTDLDELERRGAAGVLSFQSLYARAS